MTPLTKKCTKCGEVKELGEYFKKPDSKDGHRNDCKKCRVKYIREYRTRPRVIERRKEEHLKHYIKNQKKIKEYADYYRTVKPKAFFANKAKRSRDNITDGYVKAKLRRRKLPITPETIEIQRNIISAKRLKSKIKNYVREKNVRPTEQQVDFSINGNAI